MTARVEGFNTCVRFTITSNAFLVYVQVLNESKLIRIPEERADLSDNGNEPSDSSKAANLFTR